MSVIGLVFAVVVLTGLGYTFVRSFRKADGAASIRAELMSTPAVYQTPVAVKHFHPYPGRTMADMDLTITATVVGVGQRHELARRVLGTQWFAHTEFVRIRLAGSEVGSLRAGEWVIVSSHEPNRSWEVAVRPREGVELTLDAFRRVGIGVG